MTASAARSASAEASATGARSSTRCDTRLALGIQPIDGRGSRVGRPLRLTNLALGGGTGLALRLALGPPALDIASGIVARGGRAFDGLLQRRQLLVEVGQPVGADQPLGGRRARPGRDEAVPAPQHAVARDQPLPDRKLLARILVGDTDLPQPAQQLRRGANMVGQRLQPGRQAADRTTSASLPVQRRGAVAADRGVGIFAERGGERPFVAGIGRQALDGRAAAMLERPFQRLRLRPRGGQSGASRCQARFPRRPGARPPKRARLSAASSFCSAVARCAFASSARFKRFAREPPASVAPVPKRFELRSKPGTFLLRPVDLRPRRLQRGLGDPALRAHRRLARQQIGERRLGFARSCFEIGEIAADPRRLRFVVRKPLIDGGAFGVQFGNPRLGVAAQRLLALDVRRQRRIEPVELGQPAHDRVAPCPCRRQLMRQLGRPLPRLRQFVAPLRKKRRRLVLRLLRIGHRALQRGDFGLGGLAPPASPPSPPGPPRPSGHEPAALPPSGSCPTVADSALPRAPAASVARRAAPDRTAARPAAPDWLRSREASARRPCAARAGRKCRPLLPEAAAARSAWRR